jgi:cytosine/adenosine deaminase-related metal-dependent hydrolase
MDMEIFAASYMLPINGSPVAGGAIAVADGKIVATGKLNELGKAFKGRVREFPGCILMPGLVNAHTHLELTHFPGWLLKSGLGYAPRSYVDWIIQVIKVKRGVSFADLNRSLLEGCKISLQSGTTMVGDILSDRRLLPAYGDTGLAGRVYLEFIGQDPQRYQPLLESIESDIAKLPADLLPGLSPHAPFTVSQELLKALSTAAERLALPVTTHLAESAEEVQFLADGTGRIAESLFPFVGWAQPGGSLSPSAPVQWLASGNALVNPLTVVHGVHLSLQEIRLLKDQGATAVLAPRSNSNLDVGRAPAWLMKQAGLPMALGTDSLASCDSLSVFDEMRFLLDAYPDVFSPEDAVRMGTINGAEALRRGGEAGSLEVGKRGDFIVVQVDGSLAGDKIYEQLLEDSSLQGVWSAGAAI